MSARGTAAFTYAFGSMLLAIACARPDPAPARPAVAGPSADNFPFPVDRPVTEADVRARLPDHVVTRETRSFGRDPDFEVPVLCAARTVGRCEIVLTLDAEGRVEALEITTPALAGAAGLRVGEAYVARAAVLVDCRASFGDEELIVCAQVGQPNVGVTLDAPALRAEGAEQAPIEALLAEARVTRIVWHPVRAP